MSILSHSVTETRIAMPVLPHNVPKTSEDTIVLQSKITAPGKATDSKKPKKA